MEVSPIAGTRSAAYPDKFADKEIGELRVFCRNKVKGCSWSDRFKLLEVSFSLFSKPLFQDYLVTSGKHENVGQNWFYWV